MMITNVGSTMKDTYENTTKLTLAKYAIRMQIEQKLLYNKSHEIGVILAGAGISQNSLEASNQFSHIFEMQRLDKPSLQLIKEVDSLEPTTHNSDSLEPLLLAGLLMEEKYAKKKVLKRVFYITDGSQLLSNSKNISSIAKLFNSNEIRLNIIFIGYDEEGQHNLTSSQKECLDQLNQLIQLLAFKKIFSIENAINLYKRIQKRAIRPVVKFKGNLHIAEGFDMAVCTYSKTKEEKFPSLKKYSLAAEYNEMATTNKVVLDRSKVLVEDLDQKPIPSEDIIKAYPFGKNIVPISEADESSFNFTSNKGMELIGFTHRSRIERSQFMEGIDIVLPIEGYSRAFYALVHALSESDKVMICSFVNRGNKIHLIALLPHISATYTCFYLTYLPTVEDIREYNLPELKPATTQQIAATKSFITSINLCGAEGEALKPTSTFNPQIQYVNQCLIHRAMNPDSTELPPLNKAVEDYLKPDKQMFLNAQQECSLFESSFTLKKKQKEEEAKKKRVYWRDLIAKNNSESEAVKAKGKPEKDEPVLKISSINPIEDFKAMATDRKKDRVMEAITQMKDMIVRFVKDSLHGDTYDKALECLAALRDVCIKEDEAPEFNDFLYRIKKDFQTGPHSEFFIRLIKKGIQLITSSESSSSLIESVLQAEFSELEIEKKEVVKKEDDILNEIE